MKKCSGKKSRRDGIALVVTLGFLAVLTLMAVGMAISMRTERLASRSYLDMVNARTYCQAALADSMVWLEDTLAQQWTDSPRAGVGNWGDFVITPNFKQYAFSGPWGTEDAKSITARMLPSLDPLDEGDVFRESLVDGVGTNFLPYLPTVARSEMPLSSNEIEQVGAEWIHVRDAQGEVQGRYMYFIFKFDFLDINYQHREIVPGFRTGGDWDMFGGSDPEDIYRERDSSHIRYESIRDFWDAHGLGSIFEGARTEEEIRKLGYADVDSAFFSYAPPMKRIEVVREGGLNKVRFMEDHSGLPAGEMIYLEPDGSNLSSLKTEIKEAFELGIHDFNYYSYNYGLKSSDMYELLVDYIDDDFTPAGNNLDRPSIEPVPMINEIMISSNQISVEVWAPFVGPLESRYTDSFDIEGSVGTINFKTPNGIAMPLWSDDTRPPAPKRVDIVLPQAVSNGTYNVNVTVNGTGGDLDHVDLPNIRPDEYWEVNDPRFNHLPSQWKKYVSGSMGAINERTAKYVDRGNAATDGDYLMHCANRPLYSTGELGCLPIGPWRTVKTYEDPRGAADMDPILNYFTMQTNVVHGMINPNESTGMGRGSNAIFDTNNQVGGGYLGLYHEDTYESGGYNEFLHRNCFLLKNPFLSRYVSWDNRPSINPADYGSKVYVMSQHGFGGKIEPSFIEFKEKSKSNPQYSELRLEHLMRRASALMTLRQNLLIVCLWAQKLGAPESGVEDDWASYPVKSEAQAVALVWRDPYPISDDDQQHRKFVRYMRWME